ncbi:MAG: hypothetical protein IPH31_11820 [Lewinellaceae bacterium]|nr:hypothetical protein [Lewinellaceae bacterium]
MKFLSQIGCHGERGAVIPAMLMTLDGILGNPNNDTIPKEAWQGVIQTAKNKTGLSWRGFSEQLEMSYAGSTLFKHGISRSRMERIEHFYPMQKFPIWSTRIFIGIKSNPLHHLVLRMFMMLRCWRFTTS